jgi:tRNA(adenine34) deaminase
MKGTDKNAAATAAADEFYMRRALELASRAAELGETPVGCVIARTGAEHSPAGIVAEAFNLRETDKSAVAHAELLAIRKACEVLGGWRLHGCTLYVTLEPCPMCAGAIINARLDRVVFGAPDPKAGAMGSVINLCAYPFNHKPELTRDVLRPECAAQLADFFRRLRDKRNLRM